MENTKKIIHIDQLSNEYKYLGDLSITRIKDANTFWISSIVTTAGFLSVAISLHDWVPLLLIFYIIPPFIFGITWQLDGIIRVRTYIAVIIDPELHGGYTSCWDDHPIRKSTNEKYTQVIPLIFSVIYIVLCIFLLLLSHKMFPYNIYAYLGIFISPIIILVISIICMIESLSAKRTKKYIDGWLKMKDGYTFVKRMP